MRISRGYRFVLANGADFNVSQIHVHVPAVNNGLSLCTMMRMIMKVVQCTNQGVTSASGKNVQIRVLSVPGTVVNSGDCNEMLCPAWFHLHVGQIIYKFTGVQYMH